MQSNDPALIQILTQGVETQQTETSPSSLVWKRVLLGSGILSALLWLLSFFAASPTLYGTGAFSLTILGTLLGIEGYRRMEGTFKELFHDVWEYTKRVGQEFASLGYVISHYFRNLTKENYTPENVPPGQPIVLVHGLFHNSSGWKKLKARLEQKGFGPIFTVNLPSTIQAIEKNADFLRSFLKNVSEITGRQDLIVVGHSLGGMVAIACALLPETHNIHSVITMGSPLRGSRLAWAFSFLESCNELRPESTFIRMLPQRVLEKNLRLIQFCSTLDIYMLPPQDSTSLEGTDPSTHRVFSKLGHTSFLTDQEVAEAITHVLASFQKEENGSAR